MANEEQVAAIEVGREDLQDFMAAAGNYFPCIISRLTNLYNKKQPSAKIRA
jgi:hypothetical protein